MSKLAGIMVCLSSIFFAAHSPAGTSSPTPGRDDLQDSYNEHRAKRPSFFSTAPIYHIIPERDKITLSLESQLLDTVIVPLKQNSAENSTRSIELSGWQAAALASFSAKSFGIGFSAELGEKSLEFSNISLGSTYNQLSEIRFSGLGTYLYYMPNLKFLPKYMNINLILGYRKLSVLHNYSGAVYNVPVTNLQPFRYDLSTIDYGTNISILLAKHFTVLPWLNWRRIIISKPNTRASNGIDISREYEYANFEVDREMLWESEPRVSFGLDFAVKMGPLDVHFGGIFGLIANFSKGSDEVTEDGFTAGITYSFRSR